MITTIYALVKYTGNTRTTVIENSSAYYTSFYWNRLPENERKDYRIVHQRWKNGTELISEYTDIDTIPA